MYTCNGVSSFAETVFHRSVKQREPSVHSDFEDMILNMQKGHQFLKDEFNVTSRIGWNLDAFGHSAANAALYHDFGFEALFFSRVDDRLRN